MAEARDKFDAGDMRLGVDAHLPDMHLEFGLAFDSYNISSGIEYGTGPRYGMAPLPYHGHKQALSGTQRMGLVRSENAASVSGRDRLKVFGVIPVQLGLISDIKTKGFFYYWITGVDSASVLPASGLTGLQLAVASSSDALSGGIYQLTPEFDAGLSEMYGDGSGSSYEPVVMHLVNNTSAAAINSLQNIPAGTQYLSWAYLSVSGREIPQKWLAGTKISNGDATHTATATFNDLAAVSGYGAPSEIQRQAVRLNVRSLIFYNLDATKLQALYRYNAFNVLSSTFIARYNVTTAASFYDLGSVTSTAENNKQASGLTYNAVERVLLNDESNVQNTAHDVILLAPGKAMMVVLQDWQRSSVGLLTQYVDPTIQAYAPSVVDTKNEHASNVYTENGDKVATCWAQWPAYVDGTALASEAAASYDGAKHVRLGAAGSGVLRAYTTYEFAFSLFDKQFGYETNVGKPAKIYTGSDDFVRVSLYRDHKTAGVFDQYFPASAAAAVLSPTTMSHMPHKANYLELRVYYRAKGTFEWLPALFIDLAKYLYFPDHQTLWMCEGAIAGLPGGQPGGFIDNSPLPAGDYNCALIYKRRAFWISPKSMNFSLTDNVFCYPTRNSVTLPKGSFRGAIVHKVRGQSELDARLVVFGDETYSGRFTGQSSNAAVQVSPDTVAEFPVDGSDFALDFWTSNAAFSHRAAVVADGVLYWWGEQGIVRDDGIGADLIVSTDLKPSLATLYDPSKTTEIHAIYNESTEEITWFYPPKVASGYATHGLTLNVRTGLFLPQRWTAKIDWSQNVNIRQDLKISGARTMVGARYDASSTLQRAYFWDQRCRAGDMRPLQDLMVKSFTTPVAGRRRLTLATGWDATQLGTIVAGDFITFQQLTDYASSLTLGTDMICTVVSVDTGAGTIDVTIPSTGSIDASATLDNEKAFPIWHAAAAGAGLNGIGWQMLSGYWAPNGIDYWGIWTHIYLHCKVELLPRAASQSISVAYRTPTGGDFVTDNITVTDNSDGAWQAYHPLRMAQLNDSGQAIKLKLSGYQIGSQLVLQYLKAFAIPCDGDVLEEFETTGSEV